jgi:2-polyprenyl-3-methyl-5-hydroxy-6-metoxy-1,4-benzoquinol methylase
MTSLRIALVLGIATALDYWESRLNEAFNLHGTGFIGLGRHYNNWMYKIRRDVVLRKMKALQIDFTNVSVLDIGSGVGFFIDIWKGLGARVIGTDLTDVAVKNLKLKYPTDEFYTFDIGNDLHESLENRKVDIVSAFDVLFHIVDDNRYEKAIKNIHSGRMVSLFFQIISFMSILLDPLTKSVDNLLPSKIY